MPKKKPAPPPGRPAKRSKDGKLFALVREIPGPEPELVHEVPRAFMARTVGGPGHAATRQEAETPRLALEALERQLNEPVEPYDAETRQLLRTPWKRRGQPRGGAPRRYREAATETACLRLPPSLKEALQQVAAYRGTSTAEVMISALVAYIENEPTLAAFLRPREVLSTQ